MEDLNQSNESEGTPLWAAICLMLLPLLAFASLWFGG
jgi:hypothetical protein